MNPGSILNLPCSFSKPHLPFKKGMIIVISVSFCKKSDKFFKCWAHNRDSLNVGYYSYHSGQSTGF